MALKFRFCSSGNRGNTFFLQVKSVVYLLFLLVSRGNMKGVPILIGIAWYALFVDGQCTVG